MAKARHDSILVVTAAGTEIGTARDIITAINANVPYDVQIQGVQTREQAESVDFDRLLLLGGCDVNPKLYGEENRHGHGFDAHRDAIEFTLATRAIKEGQPMMGICRGIQMMAAAHGGSLIQDIDLETDITARHGASHELVMIDHPFAHFIPTKRVNSYHHQAVKTPPAGFSVMAYSPDGLIEAMHRDGAIGVQFHPEMLVKQEPGWMNLFFWWLHSGAR